MKLTAALVSALLLTAAPAFAQTQRSMNEDAARHHRTADAALNAQYQSLSRSLSPRSRELLRQAERQWITYRDAECRFRASAVAGGSAYPMVLDECLANLITDRTRQLRDLAHCPEGDLSCPR